MQKDTALSFQLQGLWRVPLQEISFLENAWSFSLFVKGQTEGTPRKNDMETSFQNGKQLMHCSHHTWDGWVLVAGRFPVWDAVSGAKQYTFEGHKAPVYSVSTIVAAVLGGGEKIIYHQLASSVGTAQEVMVRTRRARNVTTPPAPIGDVGTESNAATNHPQQEFAYAAQLAALQAQVAALTALLQN
ncbi:Uncharacterized protein Fot_51078 [Forsythia ovata]|uniref:Uncharacterized protein n=1 Tax=Forsythia ovata TaxID=205694 RepID=A0ABD1PUF5_9LAMI